MKKVNSDFLKWVGVLVAMVGFVIAGPLHNKSAGIPIFILGFYTCVASMALSAFSSKFDGFGKGYKFALKVGSIGFLISSLSFISVYSFQSESASKVLFWAGIFILIAGIIGGYIKRNEE